MPERARQPREAVPLARSEGGPPRSARPDPALRSGRADRDRRAPRPVRSRVTRYPLAGLTPRLLIGRSRPGRQNHQPRQPLGPTRQAGFRPPDRDPSSRRCGRGTRGRYAPNSRTRALGTCPCEDAACPHESTPLTTRKAVIHSCCTREKSPTSTPSTRKTPSHPKRRRPTCLRTVQRRTEPRAANRAGAHEGVRKPVASPTGTGSADELGRSTSWGCRRSTIGVRQASR